MIAIINPLAGGGTALDKWYRIAPSLEDRLGPFPSVVVDRPAEIESIVKDFLDRGFRHFVAGGGDGTVNAVASALIRRARGAVLSQVTLGALGLGSSNDFHRPRRDHIEDIPVRVDRNATVLHDVGCLTCVDGEGRRQIRYWLINASVGTTAAANRRFNAPSLLLGAIKRLSAPLAIACAAGAALASHPAADYELAVDGRGIAARRIRNLGIVKNPYFAGGLHYDSAYAPGSGDFHVHLVAEVSRLRMVTILVGLARGRFQGVHGGRSLQGSCVELRNGGSFAVEFDGEVAVARRARFSLLPRALRICS